MHPNPKCLPFAFTSFWWMLPVPPPPAWLFMAFRACPCTKTAKMGKQNISRYPGSCRILGFSMLNPMNKLLLFHITSKGAYYRQLVLYYITHIAWGILVNLVFVFCGNLLLDVWADMFLEIWNILRNSYDFFPVLFWISEHIFSWDMWFWCQPSKNLVCRKLCWGGSDGVLKMRCASLEQLGWSTHPYI